jgi:hypothetical protein
MPLKAVHHTAAARAAEPSKAMRAHAVGRSLLTSRTQNVAHRATAAAAAVQLQVSAVVGCELWLCYGHTSLVAALPAADSVMALT